MSNDPYDHGKNSPIFNDKAVTTKSTEHELPSIENLFSLGIQTESTFVFEVEQAQQIPVPKLELEMDGVDAARQAAREDTLIEIANRREQFRKMFSNSREQFNNRAGYGQAELATRREQFKNMFSNAHGLLNDRSQDDD